MLWFSRWFKRRALKALAIKEMHADNIDPDVNDRAPCDMGVVEVDELTYPNRKASVVRKGEVVPRLWVLPFTASIWVVHQEGHDVTFRGQVIASHVFTRLKGGGDQS